MTDDSAYDTMKLPGLFGRLGKELLLALDLARDVGGEVLKMRGGELGVEMKAGNEPVTKADRAASEMIVRGIRARFPDDAIVSEESPQLPASLDAKTARLWLIDPIDGTKDYIRGWDGFSVMIGLVVEGRPQLGVVHHPTAGRTFFASPEGAYVAIGGNVTALTVSAVTSAAEARLVSSASHRSDEIDVVKTTLGIADEQQIGSVGIKLSLIASGVRDLYVNPSSRSKAWDTCAPEAILVGAGGRLTDVFGAPLDYTGELARRRGLVASNGRIHDEVVAKVSPLFERLRAL
jgi:3'(2'), 5'-bisphosphate nucleotidase